MAASPRGRSEFGRPALPALAAPLAGLTVIDASTLFAGPFAARLLGDFGAEIIKVEQPSGDPLRRFGPAHDDVPLLWKVLSRNKKSVVLDLHEPGDAERFRRLAAGADALVENFRPGTLERWGLGPEVLAEVNPRLVLARVTAFGQDGPYARRPGFGTLAEAMSGLAAMSGEPDGPPALPAFPLGDAVAGLHAALAVLIALRARDVVGTGQIADVAIAETLISTLGAQLTVFEHLGLKPERIGNRSHNSAPRDVYRCADDRWVAVSAPAGPVAERVVRLVGRPDLGAEPWFATGTGRAEHRELIDDAVRPWIAARRRDEVVAAFEAAQAAVAPVYEVDDVLADPQFRARGLTVDVPDAELGSVRMPGVPFRLSATPGRIDWAGPPIGAHTDDVCGPAAPARPTAGETGA
ncbi:CaiB/BaiF CoA transferase family protein [Streptomyces olivaceus]|uniref:CaiB/BaiF CoA transferase family protein n=1 Tax=Streptomyces olivaceus TaxID=47716 RepID=UPI0040566F68